MKNKNIRIQLTDNEIEQLSEMAKSYGCIYRGRVSLSRLLSKIANGEVDLVNKKRVKNVFDNPLIEISFRVIADLDGTIGLLAQKIADVNGNIFGIKATESNTSIRMSVSLEDKCNLYNLSESFKKIAIKEIEHFNKYNEYKVEQLMKILSPETREKFIFIRHKNEELKSELVEDFFLAFKNAYIISQIEFSIGISMKIRNTPGKLADLTQRLCLSNVSIKGIEQDVDIDDENYNKAHLHLGFIPTEEQNQDNSTDTINRIMTMLEQFDYIDKESIKRITANYLSL